jgi:hypothetical protein
MVSVREVRRYFGERLAVTALAGLLPNGFRARQRAEWAADLDELPGTGQRWRYLLWAAWTLPALRAAARRAGLTGTGADKPAGAIARSGTTNAVANVLLLGLGCPVLSWLLMVPVQYRLYKVFGWSVPDDSWLIALPLAPLTWGAYIAMFGPLLVAWVCLAAVAVALTLRGADARLRASLAIGGTAVLASTLALLSGSLFVDELGSGYAIGMLAAASTGLAVLGRGLSRGKRIALLLVGFTAATVIWFQSTATAAAMTTWFVD